MQDRFHHRRIWSFRLFYGLQNRFYLSKLHFTVVDGRDVIPIVLLAFGSFIHDEEQEGESREKPFFFVGKSGRIRGDFWNSIRNGWNWFCSFYSNWFIHAAGSIDSSINRNYNASDCSNRNRRGNRVQHGRVFGFYLIVSSFSRNYAWSLRRSKIDKLRTKIIFESGNGHNTRTSWLPLVNLVLMLNR